MNPASSMRESRPRSTLDCRNGCKVVPDASQLADAASPQPIGGALVSIDDLRAVRVGSLKTAVLAEDGREQVTGYHMIGDQSNLRRLLSRGISRDQSVMLLLGSMRAEARVAAFLLDLAERYRRRGYSST
jgi:hypothetical protein